MLIFLWALQTRSCESHISRNKFYNGRNELGPYLTRDNESWKINQPMLGRFIGNLIFQRSFLRPLRSSHPSAYLVTGLPDPILRTIKCKCSIKVCQCLVVLSHCLIYVSAAYKSRRCIWI